MKRFLNRDSAAAVIALGVLVLLAGLAVFYVINKHQWAQARLAELEPRYARMAGLTAAQTDLERAESQVRETLQQLAYPSSQEATQAGNNAQQRARSVFGRAGLEVQSSQVLPPKSDKQYDRVVVTLRMEGDLLALQSALVALASEAPAMFVESFATQAVVAAKPDAPQRLSVQINLFVLRGRP